MKITAGAEGKQTRRIRDYWLTRSRMGPMLSCFNYFSFNCNEREQKSLLLSLTSQPWGEQFPYRLDCFRIGSSCRWISRDHLRHKSFVPL